ncbi:MAG: TetR/AcrR family transcriptional regulator [Ruminococcus sp.]|nr:TetR/AcrR family transcriptional regulator [Ruminococcus sp.]
MIKRTFYNLPAEKRAKIIDVTRKEFLKGNKQKITINTVIKNAGISRGSFYQYFDDKLDLVELVADDMVTRMVEFIQNELLENGGDLFALPMRLFDIMTENAGDYNIVMSITDTRDRNSELINDYIRYRSSKPEIFSKVKGYIDRSKLKNKDDEDVECVMFMMFDAIRSAMQNILESGADIKKERTLLLKKLQIIKTGSAAK